jgi:hypothetical protein
MNSMSATTTQCQRAEGVSQSLEVTTQTCFEERGASGGETGKEQVRGPMAPWRRQHRLILSISPAAHTPPHRGVACLSCLALLAIF